MFALTLNSEPSGCHKRSPHGAFRGSAHRRASLLERHMNKVADALGLTPEEFRRRNFIHEGEMTATSQIIHERW
jgi:CO/xanthine dehydrogenase Mo-binding subunit